MIEPLTFGDPLRPLAGALHVPSGRRLRPDAVVICPPIAQEQIRAHRALRQVGDALAAEGCHVLRFDWSGTGDSWGDLTRDVGVERWLEDVALAVDEVRHAANLRRVTLVGVRLGASLAALAAPRCGARTVVLWDSVLDGARYLADLVRLGDALAADRARFRPVTIRDVVRAGLGRWQPRARAADDLAGFAIAPAVRASIAGIELTRPGALAGDRRIEAHVIATDPRQPFAALIRALRAAGWPATAHVVDEPVRWTDPAAIEVPVLAPDAVTEVVSAITRDRWSHPVRLVG